MHKNNCCLSNKMPCFRISWCLTFAGKTLAFARWIGMIFWIITQNLQKRKKNKKTLIFLRCHFYCSGRSGQALLTSRWDRAPLGRAPGDIAVMFTVPHEWPPVVRRMKRLSKYSCWILLRFEMKPTLNPLDLHPSRSDPPVPVLQRRQSGSEPWGGWGGSGNSGGFPVDLGGGHISAQIITSGLFLQGKGGGE